MLDEYGRVTAYTPPVPLDVYAPGEYFGFHGTSDAALAVAGLIVLLKLLAELLDLLPEKTFIEEKIVIFHNE